MNKSNQNEHKSNKSVVWNQMISSNLSFTLETNVSSFLDCNVQSAASGHIRTNDTFRILSQQFKTGGQSKPHMCVASRKIWGVEKLETLSAAQSQGHHTIDRLEERGVEKENTRRSFLKGRERAIVSQTNSGTVSKATLWKLLWEGVERIWAFPSA